MPDIPQGPAVLIGAAIAALMSLLVQVLALWRNRRAQLKDAKFRAAAEYLASTQGVCTEYRMLDVNFRGFKLRFPTEKATSRKHEAFSRGLDAWLRYRGAYAQVMIDPPRKKVREKAEAVNSALDRWVNAIDADYLGLTLKEYETSYAKVYGYTPESMDVGKDDRDAKLQAAIKDYEGVAKRRRLF